MKKKTDLAKISDTQQKRKLQAAIGLVAMVALVMAMVAMSFTNVQPTQASIDGEQVSGGINCAALAGCGATTTTDPCANIISITCVTGTTPPTTTPPVTTINPCLTKFDPCATTTPPMTTTPAVTTTEAPRTTTTPVPETGYRIYGKITYTAPNTDYKLKVSLTGEDKAENQNPDQQANYGFNNLKSGTYTLKIYSWWLNETIERTVVLNGGDFQINFTLPN